MKTHGLLMVLLLFLVFSCQNSSKQKNKDLEAAKSGPQAIEYITQSGNSYLVRIDHSAGASICNVEIESKGFSEVQIKHKLDSIDPVTDIFLVDLDKNGFEEIYLITSSAGSGSYSTIYGFVSNKDKSVSPVYVQEITEAQIEEGLFAGFMGHNHFSVIDGKLVNSFPVFLKEDTNSNPTGGNRTVGYVLLPGEAGWILKPEKVIEK